MSKHIFIVLILYSFLIPFTDAQIISGRPNYRPLQYHKLPLGLNSIGPESVTFDCEGRGPYTGVSDGRILRWENSQIGWVQFAVTNPYRSPLCDGLNNSPLEQLCGRPLGLKFNNVTCELYVADSSFGLLRVGRNGGIAIPVATSFEGTPFHFLNALDIDVESDIIYFTDTSLYNHRWNWEIIVLSGDRSGRLMKYDMITKNVTILLGELSFANGVALSRDKNFILIAETSACVIRRLWLKGPRAGVSEVFVTLNGGFPDNINRNDNGDFWITQNPNPPIKVDQYGRTLEVLNAKEVVDVSDVTEYGNDLWIGSVIQPYVLYTT